MEQGKLHLTEDALELYSLKILPEVEAAELEHHLLTCEFCRFALDRTDKYIAVMKRSIGQMNQRRALLSQKAAEGKILMFKLNS